MYRYFEAIYRTQVEYIVSLTCQIWQLGTLMYKKDNYVTVLGQMKSAIMPIHHYDIRLTNTQRRHVIIPSSLFCTIKWLNTSQFVENIITANVITWISNIDSAGIWQLSIWNTFVTKRFWKKNIYTNSLTSKILTFMITLIYILHLVCSEKTLWRSGKAFASRAIASHAGGHMIGPRHRLFFVI